MRRIILVFVLFIGLTAAGFQTATAVENTGNLNLDFTLPVPEDSEQRSYLGLKSGDSFTLDKVKADILLIEIFSMYCPICQREAPKINELFEAVRAAGSPDIRLIGIGAGNSAYEVSVFKESYRIAFPLFSDGSFKIHKKIGERGTPFIIGLNQAAPEGQRVFFTHSGDIGDPDDFFKRVLDAWEER
ncbi:MAG: TlpA family protein disulfide reductase [Desulfobacterales bacterium]|nr:TlpA family protein disulfide reductase [Desulfobacterales bacterium]